ncbi:MAG TPA: hypothetical protein VFV34_17400 [Blastocatellia bacterium]|nr:hypothetical protein [Blastocatellia bacterium]
MTSTKTILRSLALASLVALSTVLSACGSETKEARKPVEESLKKVGVKDVQVDFFLKAADIPNKAYMSVTATWGFATSSGSPQKEYLGYILKKDDSGWKIEKTTGYTKESEQARKFLEGGK